MKPEAYAALFKPGAKAVVNGDGDLMMIREKGALIGHTVEIVKRCKSGLIQVKYAGKVMPFSLAQRNLDLIEEAP